MCRWRDLNRDDVCERIQFAPERRMLASPSRNAAIERVENQGRRCQGRGREEMVHRPAPIRPSGTSSAIYLAGSFAPLALASESPMAMACSLLLTRLPLFPLFKLPSFSLCIARLTDRCALLPYLAIRNSFLSIDLRIDSGIAVRAKLQGIAL
jgi:hypothetical protein